MRTITALVFAAAMLAGQERLVEGNPKSPVRVIAYEDLQCSDCAIYRKTMDEKLLPKYAGTVAFEHRDFPLGKHLWAKPAAVAARYFDGVKPELGVAFRQWAMANQESIQPETFEAKLVEWAKLKGQDAARVKAALADAKLVKAVQEDYEEGVARGVARTPTVFVNGEPFIETFTAEEISKGIDAALAAFQTK
ncbi:MAG: thioredoxin domain-containing protein [Bryobacteraceae bacterium]|nr:thioredoxin domain-containing protein [Bryobacteraceae bacterium]